jgi:Abortive infection C-terminus
MKVAERTIRAIQKIITGDHTNDNRCVGPYQSGPSLVQFFNEFGFNDVYPAGGGFPSRWSYCEDKLRELNDTPRLQSVLEAALHPQRFLDTGVEADTAVAFVNKYLKFDGFEVRPIRGAFKVVRLDGNVIEATGELPEADPLTIEFMQEQIAKCRNKLDADDFDGAITNARSLIEAVLVGLEKHLDTAPPSYEGDLPKLYKRVRKLMKLDPDAREIDDALKPILTGLSSVIYGLAGTRNKMSDAHARTYRPARHHAKLAVNAANTLADFLIESYVYQRQSS